MNLDLDILGEPNTIVRNGLIHLNRETELSGPNKNWISIQVIRKRLTCAKVALRLGIDRKCIFHWVQNVRRGRTNHSIRGRPQSLDNLAVENVKQICVEEPDINEYQKRWIIDGEYKKTVLRRRVDIEADDIRSLSLRSKKRYSRKCDANTENLIPPIVDIDPFAYMY